MNEQEWIQYGIDNGYVHWYCLNHDTGLTVLEADKIEDNEDICVDGFRLASQMNNSATPPN